MRNAYWAVAKVAGDNPAMANAMVAAPIPTNAPNATTLATMTPTSISSSCAHPDEAWKFIKFEAEPKWSIMRAKVANWMPLRSDLVDNPEIQGDPMLKAFLEMGRNARTYPLPHPLWADIAAGDIVDAVQKALLDPDKTEAVFKELDVKLTKKLNDL
jgi:multiple sugar transport system substrate-binding protein